MFKQKRGEMFKVKVKLEACHGRGVEPIFISHCIGSFDNGFHIITHIKRKTHKLGRLSQDSEAGGV